MRELRSHTSPRKLLAPKSIMPVDSLGVSTMIFMIKLVYRVLAGSATGLCAMASSARKLRCLNDFLFSPEYRVVLLQAPLCSGTGSVALIGGT